MDKPPAGGRFGRRADTGMIILRIITNAIIMGARRRAGWFGDEEETPEATEEAAGE